MLGCTRAGVSPNLLPATVGTRVWGLLLEEGSVEVRRQIHNLVRICLDTAILRSENESAPLLLSRRES